MTVSADGRSLIRVDKLFRSCLRLASNPPDLPADARPVALFMTHLVSNTPVETHVFLSLQFDIDFAVGTPPNGEPWYITNGQLIAPGAQ